MLEVFCDLLQQNAYIGIVSHGNPDSADGKALAAFYPLNVHAVDKDSTACVFFTSGKGDCFLSVG